MKISQIKHRLAQNAPCLITALVLNEAPVYEMASAAGLDGLWMDLEHRSTSLESAQHLITAARAGGSSDILARCSRHEYSMITRLLEIGAQGIMYPRCSDASEAREVIKAAKFAPVGERGCDGWTRDGDYGKVPVQEYIQSANEQTFVIIQIESPEAVRNAEDILAVDGVDALMFGKADFSVMSGIAGQMDAPQIVDASHYLCEAATKAGKHYGEIVPNVEAANELVSRGGRLLFHSADLVMISDGLQQMKNQFSDIRGHVH